MNIVNCTPHTINHYKGETVIEYPYTGNVPRVELIKEEFQHEPDGPILKRCFYGDIVGMPPREHDTLYIVSRMVADACDDRDDLIIPIDFVRDQKGHIMGCRAFEVLR